MRREDEGEIDSAAGDPVDEPLSSLAWRALVALDALGRPSRTADRSAIARRERIPPYVFGWLGRAAALVPVDGAGKLREVSALGLTWIQEPLLIEARERGDSAALKRMHRVLAEFARAEGLPVQSDAPHILADASQWPANLWRPLQASGNASLWPARKDLHRWVHHLRSSQAFAFNLFGPLAVAANLKDRSWAWAEAVWEPFVGNVQRVEFEYPSSGDPLNEDPARQGARTRVDVVLHHPNGLTTFVEVKLTEPEFGTCSAGHDDENPRHDFCESPGWTEIEASRSCYLTADKGRAYFGTPTSSSAVDFRTLEARYGQSGCPLRNGAYQIARNLLMASAVARDHQVSRFLVFAPGARLNRHLHGKQSLYGNASMTEFLQSVASSGQIDVGFVPFEEVLVRASQTDGAAAWADYLRRKYLSALEAGT